MLAESGHRMEIFDPIYAPDDKVFQEKEKYDFITSTEVIEHLTEPGLELRRLWDCLKTGGTLALMTKFMVEESKFPSWYYKLDPTHICFYSENTFRWLAGELGGYSEFPNPDVAFLHKRGPKRTPEQE
eukprot:TRINITY_DN9874_c0_g1_i1.p1 TRINITY_DN9874_c0_g1~~TRINITY_DN9874_c0_g1_i1.p1  ORF type:complete len:128 (-),score=15.95 TRINITY_DN9874_c0_g1_i1:97-480(-)